MQVRILLFTIAMCSSACAQNFSCQIGMQPACLNYGETVCVNRGVCVDENAACYNKYQCDFQGFTCVSFIQECKKSYDELLRQHNELVEKFNRNLESAIAVESRVNEIANCLREADILEQAKLCLN